MAEVYQEEQCRVRALCFEAQVADSRRTAFEWPSNSSGLAKDPDTECRKHAAKGQHAEIQLHVESVSCVQVSSRQDQRWHSTPGPAMSSAMAFVQTWISLGFEVLACPTPDSWPLGS